MKCSECCLTCGKDKKTCEARKERGRAVNRAIYKARRTKK